MVVTWPILTSTSVCSGSNFQGRRDIGVEPHRDLPCDRTGRGRGGRDLGRAVKAGGAAEPVVERHGRVGCADHQRDHAAADRGDQRVAPQTTAHHYCRLWGHVLRYGRLLIHLSHIGRTSTAGPLTMVTAKNSTTRTPSASAIAIER